MRFVAGFRMNNTHIKSYPNSALSPEFWKTYQHYRLGDATDGKGYYNAALDYSYPEVRNRYRDAIAGVSGGVQTGKNIPRSFMDRRVRKSGFERLREAVSEEVELVHVHRVHGRREC